LTTKFEKLNDETHKTLHFAHQTRNKQRCTNKIKNSKGKKVENGKGEKMKQKQKMAMGVAHIWIQI
jgi:hypothetical protein